MNILKSDSDSVQTVPLFKLNFSMKVIVYCGLYHIVTPNSATLLACLFCITITIFDSHAIKFHDGIFTTSRNSTLY